MVHQIWCSLDGVYIDHRGIKMQMIISEPKETVSWLEQLEINV